MACLVHFPHGQQQPSGTSGAPSTATASASQPSSLSGDAARSGEDDTSSRETEGSGHTANGTVKVGTPSAGTLVHVHVLFFSRTASSLTCLLHVAEVRASQAAKSARCAP
jgi:hypothetical protein